MPEDIKHVGLENLCLSPSGHAFVLPHVKNVSLLSCLDFECDFCLPCLTSVHFLPFIHKLLFITQGILPGILSALVDARTRT